MDRGRVPLPVSSWELQATVSDRLPGQQVLGIWLSHPAFPPSSAGSTGTCCHYRLFLGPGNPNSGPPVCPASPSLTDPSPQPSVSFVVIIHSFFYSVLFYSPGWPGTRCPPVSASLHRPCPARSFCFCSVLFCWCWRSNRLGARLASTLPLASCLALPLGLNGIVKVR